MQGARGATSSEKRYGVIRAEQRLRSRDGQSDRKSHPTCIGSNILLYARSANVMKPPHATWTIVGLLALFAPAYSQSALRAQPMRTAVETDSTQWNPAPGRELIAEDRTCPRCDEGEGEGEGEPEAADGGRGVGSAERYLRHLVPIGASALVIAYAFSGTRRKRRHGPCTIMLAVCAILAVGNYTYFGLRPNDSYVNSWEFFHYYLVCWSSDLCASSCAAFGCI